MVALELEAEFAGIADTERVVLRLVAGSLVVVAVELAVKLTVIADTFCQRVLVTSTVPGHKQANSSRDE